MPATRSTAPAAISCIVVIALCDDGLASVDVCGAGRFGIHEDA